jgi:hypothetical protein
LGNKFFKIVIIIYILSYIDAIFRRKRTLSRDGVCAGTPKLLVRFDVTAGELASPDVAIMALCKIPPTRDEFRAKLLLAPELAKGRQR